MSSFKEISCLHEPPHHPARQLLQSLLAASLASTSALLARLAGRLADRPRPSPASSIDPRFEFHAEAGAPEGALYVDGRLIGRLPGVSRL